MAIDQPLKRKRERPAGSHSQPSKNKMEQKIALVKKRLALLDRSSSSESEIDKGDDDVVPMDEKLAIDVNQQAIVIDCDDADDEVGVVPLQVSAVNGQKIRASVQDNCGSAMARAKVVQAKLPAEHPSFVKYMRQSHVVRGFWLGLPSDFCNKHLPKHDAGIVLEDEDGHNYDTSFLGMKQGLSAGWRGFSIKHGIKVGDAVVFQLVRSTKFKVYIIRANNFTTTTRGLLSLAACKKGRISKEERSDDARKDPKVTRVSDKVKEGRKVIIVSDKVKEDPKVISFSSKVAHNDSNNLAGEAIDGIGFSDSDVDFDDVTSFSNFNIIVDRLVIDCKFADHLRRTYYELCCAQKSFLHKHLLKQLNLTLVVGVIMETINIAEGIRACKAHASSHVDFLIWKKTLESFELLGMDVAFLLKRVKDLLGLPAQSRDPAECEKYKEVKVERARAGEKMKVLESKLSNLKDALSKMDVEMEEMESIVKKSDQALQRVATAPW